MEGQAFVVRLFSGKERVCLSGRPSTRWRTIALPIFTIRLTYPSRLRGLRGATRGAGPGSAVPCVSSSVGAPMHRRSLDLSTSGAMLV